MTNFENEITNDFLFDNNLTINEKYVEKLVKYLNKNQKNKLVFELTIHNPKTLEVIYYILNKSIRTFNDLYLINSYLFQMENFINLLKTYNSSIEQLVGFISSCIKPFKAESNKMIIHIGEKGNQFFIILKGSVSVLVPKERTIRISQKDYENYLKMLFNFNENYLLENTIKHNNKIYKIKEKEIKIIDEDLKKLRKEIKNLDEYLSYINCYYIKEENIFEEIRILGYFKVVELQQGNSFGEIALINDNNLRTASIYVNSSSLFGVLNSKDYKKSVKNTQLRIKRNNIIFILNVDLFAGLSYGYFNTTFWNYFIFKQLKKGEYLFKEGEKRQFIYFIRRGEIKLTSILNYKKINNLISYFTNTPLKKSDNEDIGQNEDLIISYIHKKDNLGIVTVNNNHFCNAIIISEKVDLFAIDIKNLKYMSKIFSSIKEQYDISLKNRIKIYVDRLNNIKNTYLNTYKGEFRNKNEDKINLDNKSYNIKDLFYDFNDNELKESSIPMKFINNKLTYNKKDFKIINNNILRNKTKTVRYRSSIFNLTKTNLPTLNSESVFKENFEEKHNNKIPSIDNRFLMKDVFYSINSKSKINQLSTLTNCTNSNITNTFSRTMKKFHIKKLKKNILDIDLKKEEKKIFYPDFVCMNKEKSNDYKNKVNIVDCLIMDKKEKYYLNSTYNEFLKKINNMNSKEKMKKKIRLISKNILTNKNETI